MTHISNVLVKISKFLLNQIFCRARKPVFACQRRCSVSLLCAARREDGLHLHINNKLHNQKITHRNLYGGHLATEVMLSLKTRSYHLTADRSESRNCAVKQHDDGNKFELSPASCPQHFLQHDSQLADGRLAALFNAQSILDRCFRVDDPLRKKKVLTQSP